MMFLRKALLLAVLAATIADASSQEQGLRGRRRLQGLRGRRHLKKGKKKKADYQQLNKAGWQPTGGQKNKRKSKKGNSNQQLNKAGWHPTGGQKNKSKNKKGNSKQGAKGSYVLPNGVIPTTWKPSDIALGTSSTVNKVATGSVKGTDYVGGMNLPNTPANVNVVTTYTPPASNNRVGGQSCRSDNDCPGVQCCGTSNYGCFSSLPKGGVPTPAVVANMKCLGMGSGTSYTVNKVASGTGSVKGTNYVGSVGGIYYTPNTPANVNVVTTYTPPASNNRVGGRSCRSDKDCPRVQCCGTINYGCLSSLPKGGNPTPAVLASMRCLP